LLHLVLTFVILSLKKIDILTYTLINILLLLLEIKNILTMNELKNESNAVIQINDMDSKNNVNKRSSSNKSSLSPNSINISSVKKDKVTIYHIDHADDPETDKLIYDESNTEQKDLYDNINEKVFTHAYDDCSIAKIDNTLHCHETSDIFNRNIVKVKHHDHYDILVGNRLHYVHDDHCDDHGRIELTPELSNIKSKKNKKLFSKLWRFVVMSIMTGSFFFVELIVGITIGSLALQADAFHMLSDLAALAMAFYAALISDRKETDTATFGMTRSEIIGGLINSVFLLSSCFFIMIEVIQRFIEFQSHHVDTDQILTLIIVGALGLGINLIGMIIFGLSSEGGHGHSHGGHGHSHGGHGHSHGGHGHSHGDHEGHSHSSKSTDKPKIDRNIRALFLHVFGDALGSIGVIISGLIIKYVDSEYKFLADPAISVFIIFLIMGSAIPLVVECIHILMHKVPGHIDLKKIRENIYKLKGVQNVHHLHVWPLNDSKIVATLHIKIDEFVEIDETVIAIEKLFHNAGAHSTTIQVEIITYKNTINQSDNNIDTSSDSNKGTSRNKAEIAQCINIVCEHERCQTDVCCNNEQHHS